MRWLIAIALFLPSIIFGWWDNDYFYRRELWVKNTIADEATNYAVPVTINHANWVTNDSSQADGDDIRFIKSEGETQCARVLDCESAWNLSNTVVWFKCGTISANDSVRFYLYFGNSGATNPGYDESDVFVDAEGFEDYADGTDVTSVTDWSELDQFHIRCAQTTGKCQIGLTDDDGNVDRTHWSCHIQPHNDAHFRHYDGGSWSDLQAYSADTWYKFEFYDWDFANETFDVDIADVNKGDDIPFHATVGSDAEAFQLRGNNDAYPAQCWFDNMILRRKIPTEPTVVLSDSTELGNPPRYYSRKLRSVRLRSVRLNE